MWSITDHLDNRSVAAIVPIILPLQVAIIWIKKPGAAGGHRFPIWVCGCGWFGGGLGLVASFRSVMT